MAKLRLGQTNFSAGQFSAQLAARSDVSVWRNGAEQLVNMMPLWQGGATSRFGLTHLATLPVSPVRLADFVFDASQKYAFAFSNTALRVYLPDGTLAATLTGAPWTQAMLPQLNWTAYGDTMILVHPDGVLERILRTGATTFTRPGFAFEEHASGAPRYQPYAKFMDPAITLTPAATTGSGINMTLGGTGAGSGVNQWTAAHVGTIIRYQQKEILITSVTSATVAVGTIRQTLPGTSASTDWDEQVFSAVYGYPRAVCFINNRLCFAGHKTKRTGIWLSKIGAYFNFDLGTAKDNEAIWEAWQGERIAEIRHVAPSPQGLLIWSDQALGFAPSSDARPITPANWQIKTQQPFGAGYARPAGFDGAYLYVQATGGAVREAFWVDTAQQFTALAVTVLTDVVKNPQELAAVYGTLGRPENYAFAVNGDGTLGVFHSYRAEKMAAWAHMETAGVFKSVCVLYDTVLFAVERVIDGNTVLFLEKLDFDRAPLDAAKRVTAGSPTKTFAGFGHLANATVQVVSKGHPLGPYTVSGGGVITLDDLAPEVTEIEAGLYSAARVRPMPVDFDLPDGPGRGLLKSLVRALLLVDRSASFRVQGKDVLLDFQGDDFTMAPTKKTGIVEIFLLGNDREAQFDLVVPQPVRITLLGLTREVAVGG